MIFQSKGKQIRVYLYCCERRAFKMIRKGRDVVNGMKRKESEKVVPLCLNMVLLVLLSPMNAGQGYASPCLCRCIRVEEVCESFQTTPPNDPIDNVTQWDRPTAHSLCLNSGGYFQIDTPGAYGPNCQKNCFRWGIGADCYCTDGDTDYIPAEYTGPGPYYETI